MAVLKIARLWPSSKPRAAAAPSEPAGLDAFSSEAGGAGSLVAPFPGSKTAPANAKPAKISPRHVGIVVGIIGCAALIGAGAYFAGKRPVLWAAAPGSVSFETTPSDVEVAVAGKSVGRTPLKLSLPAGSYEVRLGSGATARVVSVAVTSGTSVVQHYEMPATPVAPVPVVGSLRVETDPVRQPIFLDGVSRGLSPVTLEDVSPGDHVIATGAERAVKRTVHVTAGQSTAVILAAAAAPPVDAAAAVTGGWLTVNAPIALQVKEGGRLIGSSDVERLMIPSGDHSLELANDSLGFRAQRTVKIAAGKSTQLKIDVPNGTMSLNALPWADVFVDGEKVGQTPIGNLARPIGRHEVVFRHPTLGERKESVVVTTKQPVRLGVDLRK